jgi:hypothetical protein
LNDDLEGVCAELKERCYQRGAEDNLTVVIVRVGQRITADQRLEDLEPTITPETQPIFVAPNGNQTVMEAKPESTFVAPSRIAFPGPPSEPQPVIAQETLNVAAPAEARGGSGAARLFMFVLVLALIGGAFYAGARFKERIPFLAGTTKVAPTPEPTPKPAEEPFLQFERARREVDRDPRAWLASDIGKELLSSGVQQPLDSPNPEFLYLYGRANLLTGNSEEAATAFENAIAKADASPSVTNATIKKEATLGLAAVSLKSLKARQKALLHYDDLTKPPATQTAP